MRTGSPVARSDGEANRPRRCGSGRSESVRGTEQAGKRPALVLQIDRANAASPHTLIAPFTSKVRRSLLPSHVAILAGTAGLKLDSVLLCEQIRVIDRRRIVRVMGHLDETFMEDVAVAVRTILGV